MRKVKVLVAQLCQTLCNPKECSAPDSSVHRIFRQAYSSGCLPNQIFTFWGVHVMSDELTWGLSSWSSSQEAILSLQGVQIWSPFTELRSHTLCDKVKKGKKKKKKKKRTKDDESPCKIREFSGISVGKKKKPTCSAADPGSGTGLGRSPGEGNPLQYSCLENPLVRGAWWDTVHGVVSIRHDLVTKPPPVK